MAVGVKKPTKLKRYQIEQTLSVLRANPLMYFERALGVPSSQIWSKMREICESVRDHKKTCVPAGHGVSKSFTAARLVLWFLTTHVPATVITTAPTNHQVENVLWREVADAYAKAAIPMGGTLTRKMLQYGPKQFALGFSTTPDSVTGEATKFQGYHNDNILVIFDEAAGIMPQIWRAAQHLLTAGNCKWLAIGNPTTSQGEFFEAQKPDSGWNVVRVAVTDTPNYISGEEVIPGLSGRAYEAEIREKYGENSNEYNIRILGLPPKYQAGTLLGPQLADADSEGRTEGGAYDGGAKVYTFWDIGDKFTAIWFVQFIGPRINLVDFLYDGQGQGMPYYAHEVQMKPYIYAEHWGGWDIKASNAGSFQTGMATIEVAERLGIHFECCQTMSRADRIELARGVVSKCWFAPQVQQGVQGLRMWRLRKNEALSTDENPVYYEDPVKDWSSHVGDAFSHMAIAYRYHALGGEYIGLPEATKWIPQSYRNCSGIPEERMLDI